MLGGGGATISGFSEPDLLGISRGPLPEERSSMSAMATVRDSSRGPGAGDLPPPLLSRPLRMERVFPSNFGLWAEMLNPKPILHIAPLPGLSSGGASSTGWGDPRIRGSAGVFPTPGFSPDRFNSP